MVVLARVVHMKHDFYIWIKALLIEFLVIVCNFKTNAPGAGNQVEPPVSHAAICVSDAVGSTFKIHTI